MLGEDIGVYGGAFKVTEGFIERFGPERVMDTPIAEETIVGMALGAAMEGFRPVAEFQYADFMSSGFDEITTALARYHYRSGVPAPVVLRAPSGGGVRASENEKIRVNLPSCDLIRQAVQMYMERAYDSAAMPGPQAKRLLPPDGEFDVALWLMSDTVEKSPPRVPLEQVKSFALRLGNSIYPNMKLRISRIARLRFSMARSTRATASATSDSMSSGTSSSDSPTA
jgi:hypothetical protein